MSDEEIEYDRAVGYLVFIRKDKSKSFTDIPIQANAQFSIGRQDVMDALGLSDMKISTNHLRFHCVMYGDDEADKVAPMVYVRVLSSNPVLITQIRPADGTSTCHLHRDGPDVLLNHGDTLKLTSKISLEYSALYDGQEPRPPMDVVHQLETKQFAEEYNVTPRKLGSGGYASVYLAINRKARRQVACKIVPVPEKPPLPDTPAYQIYQKRVRTTGRTAVEKAVAHQKKLQDLRREFEILKDIDHPNIIRLKKAIYSTGHVYIFQELIPGGDLMSYLEKKQGLAQPEAAVIIMQLLKAVDYLHDNGVVHRDIKPENVLMTSWREGDRVVLTDFGQSTSLNGGSSAASERGVFRMQSVVGTLGYTAPEVQKQTNKHAHRQLGYSKAVDIWSIGCLTGTLFTNQFLFVRDTNAGDFAPPAPGSTTTTDQYDLEFLDTKEEWMGICGKAKSFIRSCVVVSEEQRLTAKQALEHRFLNHPQYAEELQAVYGRAVASWKPRKGSVNLIEYRRPSNAATAETKKRFDARLHEEVKSKHFAAGPPPVSQFRDFAPFAQPTKQRHTPLSPVDTDADVVVSDSQQWSASKSRTQAKSNLEATKVSAPEESYFSIEDFAPPITQSITAPYLTASGTLDPRWLTQEESAPVSDTLGPQQKKARL